jgi:anaerobic ribonucleoside-triphosphate reductase activating protein
MSNDKMVRLAGIIHESMVNGPGIRRVLFAQGCVHNCEACFNPETHSLEGGELKDMDRLIEDINSNPMLVGVTFSGGDPFEQPEEFAYLAKNIKKDGKNIWCYTGYTFEYILENIEKICGWKDLLNNIDVLIDGKFIKNKVDNKLKFKGSSNQRIINVTESLLIGKVVEIIY